jgi:hypothetical protein
MPRLATPRPARSLRRGLAATIVCAFALLPSSALAAQPIDRFHAHFTDSFSDQICGTDVDVEVKGTDNLKLFADWSFKDTTSVRGTITNPLNGKAVVLSVAGQASGSAPTIDEAAGTITFQVTLKGLPEKIQTSHGSVLLRDAGVIAFADTFDLETGEFVSSETTVDKGPHPEADSDFTRFCDVVSGALS